MPVPSLLVHRLGPASQRVADQVLAVLAGLLCAYAVIETPPVVLPEPIWLGALAGVLAGAALLARRRWPATGALTAGLLSGTLLATGIVPDYASFALVAVAAIAL